MLNNWWFPHWLLHKSPFIWRTFNDLCKYPRQQANNNKPIYHLNYLKKRPKNQWQNSAKKGLKSRFLGLTTIEVFRPKNSFESLMSVMCRVEICASAWATVWRLLPAYMYAMAFTLSLWSKKGKLPLPRSKGRAEPWASSGLRSRQRAAKLIPQIPLLGQLHRSSFQYRKYVAWRHSQNNTSQIKRHEKCM